MSNPPGKIAGILDLTPLQQGMLVLATDADSANGDPYIIQTWGTLRGLTDITRFEAAWQSLIQRHAALRSAFVFQGQAQPRQVVLREALAPVQVQDCRELAEGARQAHMNAWHAQDLQAGFNMTRPPLARIALFRTSIDEWQFLLTHHHLILDGWSVAVLFADLQQLLAGDALTTEAIGPEVISPRLADAAKAAGDPFWRAMLASWSPPDLGDTVRSGDVGVGASRLRQTLPTYVVTTVRETARRLGVTPAAVTAAAWLLALCRSSGQRRVTTGVTTSGRAEDVASQCAVGMFVNTLPLCIELHSGETLDAFVRRVAGLWRGLVERDQTDIAALRPVAGASAGQPLFDALIAFENFPQTPTQTTGVQIQAKGSHERTNLATALIVIPELQQWRLELQIEHARMSPDQAGQLLGLLGQTTELFVRPGTVAVDEAWMRLGEGQTVRAVAPTLLPASTPRDLLAWWSASLQASPDSVATRDGARTLTRRQLDQLSRRCAAALTQNGVRLGDRVALCMERSDTLLAMMLGVVRAGACYVPIDPHQGPSRRAQVITDSRPACVVCDADLAEDGDLVAQALLDAVPQALDWQDRPVHPLAPAYIIYTSGSTGAPKGVMVCHQNVVQLIAACHQRMELGSRDVWSFFHSFAFDFSVWEIWGAWLTGGSVLVVPYEVSRDALQFVDLCQAQGVTVLSQTPSAFKGFEQAEGLLTRGLSDLRYIVFGGEAAILGSLRRWTQRHGDQKPALINMYGITETTVHVTFCQLDAATIASDGVAPIGGPLAHLSMKSERASGLASLIGQPGEIVVGGRGVALGYFNQARLTAERFVPDPQALAPGERAYRSGDLVVVDGSGQWRPQGRADRQVKLRGFRIEPGEIESALSGLDSVAACTVHAIPKSAKSGGGEEDLGLCAWVVPLPSTQLDTQALLRSLQPLVPPHMLPERIVPIPALPLTASGKIDVTRLPNPWLAVLETTSANGVSKSFGGTPADPPADTLVSALCEAWQEALSVPRVRPFDTFFAVGGDSVRSLKVTSACRARGLQFPLGKLLENPTPASLANWIRAQKADPATIAQADKPSPSLPAPFALLDSVARDSLRADVLDAWPATRLQIGMMFHAGYGDDTALYEDLFSWRLALDTTPDRLTHAMARLCQRHPVLSSRFQQTGDVLMQVLPETKLAALALHDLRGLPAPVREQRLVEINQELAQSRVDPFAGPLFRAAACELDEGQWHIALLFHHAIVDGWSVSLLTAEWFELSRMTTAADDANADAAQARVDAAAQALHADAERQALSDQAMRKRWADRLGTEPMGRLWRWPAAPGEALLSHGQAQLALKPDILHRLRVHADAGGVHLKHFLLGIYGAVAAWAQGAHAVSIGVVMNGRPDIAGADQAVGMFLNTLPIKLSGHGNWIALAQAAARAELSVFADRAMPLAELQRLTGGPSFEMSFNFVHFHSRQAMERAGATAGNVETREYNSLSIAVTFGLSPDGQTLNGQIQNGEPMTSAQLQWLAQGLEQALEQAATAPYAEVNLRDPLAPCPVLPLPAEQDPRPFEPVHDAVLRRMRAAPGAVVMIDAYGVPLLAEELLTLHGRYVAHLQATIPMYGRPCALHLPRSAEMIAAMLAAASCGAWTVYLDAKTPVARRVATLAALHDPVVLHHSGLDDLAPLLPATTIDLAQTKDTEDDDNEEDLIASPQAPPQAIAYCIFTSGSTGTPKGVAIPHGALAAHMAWFNRAFGFGPGDRILYRTHPSFDASVWELWAPLMTGAVLVIAPDDAMGDPQYIAEAVARQRITALQLVPTLLEVMSDAATLKQLSGLRYLFLGGEALKRNLVLNLMTALPKLSVVNLYGPTETAIQVCIDIAQADAPEAGSIWPIGRPVDATHAVVVNEQLQPLPTGAEGELLIGGAQVGQSYLGLPRMTALRFVPDPFGAPGARAFRTGDRVRRLPDGRLAYLGRNDEQIKIAGNRVELGEIETLLAQTLTGGLRSAAGVWTQYGTAQLVGYMEWPADQLGFDDAVCAARGHLERLLPRYMVPARFFAVPSWPLLSSGKTDRKALQQASLDSVTAADPLATTQRSARVEVDPQTGLVQRLLGVLLGKHVAAGDDFFDLGGDSIIAMQLVARLRAQGFSVSPRQIFEQRLVELIATQLRPLAVARAALPEPAPDHLQPLPAQQWFARLALRQPGWWNQVVSLRLVRPVAGSALSSHLIALGQRHRVLGLRLTSDGRWTEGDPHPRIDTWELNGVPPELLASQRRQRMSLLQTSFDLNAGPIWGALLELDVHGEVRQAHVAIHHLAVDGYSWRLLFTQLNQLLSNQALDTKGPSAMAVAAALSPVGNSAAMDHWREHARRLVTLDASQPRMTGSEAATKTRQFTVLPTTSTLLLQRCERDWRMPVEALLGGVLLFALGQLDKSEHVDLAIEHHGRDAADVAELDTEHTVGWFTSLYPLIAARGESLLGCLREFKRAHRIAISQPTDWLRACMLDAKLAASPAPSIVLNYLGSFDNSFNADSYFVASADDIGPAIGPDNTRTSALDLVALVEGGQLRVNLSADGVGRWGTHVDALAEALETALQSLAEAGCDLAATALWLPQDFAADLDDADLQALLSRWPGLQDILPVTPTQHGMLFTHQRHGGGDGTHVQQVEFQLSKDVDPDGIRAGFDALLQRHETLRTTLVVTASGQAVQLVHAHASMPLTIMDLSGEAKPAERWSDFVAEDARRGFDVACPPLSRVTLARLGPTSLRVLWTHHHLVIDGWSLQALLDELALPAEALAERAAPTPRTPFWDWLRERATAPSRERQRKLWQSRFSGFTAPDRIQSITRADSAPNSADSAIEFSMPEPQWLALKQHAQAAGITASTLAQAAWGLLLSRLLRTRDLAIGVTVSGRPPELAGAAQWVGMFINTLPLRVTVQPMLPARSWLQALQAQAVDLQSNCQDSLADIPRWIGADHLIDTVVVFLNYPPSSSKGTQGALAMPDRVVARERNEYPVSLYAVDAAGLRMTLRFDPHVVDRALAAVLAEGVAQILESWSDDFTRPVGATPFMSRKRFDALLARGSSADRVNPPTLIERIAAQAHQRGDAVALIWGEGQTMSYGELLRRSEYLARRLHTHHGCGQETLVAIAGHREPETVIALLAAMWCGAAFLPLDPEQPLERLAMICEDAGPVLLLGLPAALTRLATLGLTGLELDGETTYSNNGANTGADIDATLSAVSPFPPATRHPLDLAYMLFTSGSTGRPKGVSVGSRALDNAILSMAQRPGIGMRDTLASVTTISFDIALLEILAPLATGARLRLVDPYTARDGRALCRLLQAEAVTVLQATPATWKLLREAGLHAPALRSWCGGEALKADLADWLQVSTAEVWNLYGPTETTIWSSVGQLGNTTAGVHVGQAIAQTTVCLVDEDLAMTLDGAIGEVAISGAGVSRGYPGQAGRTGRQFVPAIDGSGERMYLTGDMGRWRSDGQLEILGRIDRQLKIQGFRIEPEEIEQALLVARGVGDAVAAVVPAASVGETGEPVLLAWVVAEKGATLDPHALRLQLMERLPNYMVPAQILTLAALPLTPNRKVDVSALPLPAALRAAATASISPQDTTGDEPQVVTTDEPLTQVVALLMGRVLGLGRAADAHDDFFSLGGQSLLAMQLRTLLERFTSLGVDLRLIFDLRTPARIACGLSQLTGGEGLAQRASDTLQQIETPGDHGA
ncbi:MAG: amino acid adenylation domain-containing protein [Rhodospirillales bacterium]|jgi:amino acid adenylation domain-containing protein